MLRIDQLSRDRTGKRAVVFLMQGHSAMSSFMRFQLRMLEYESISAMPISRADRLVTHLDALRKPSITGMNGCAQISSHEAQRDLLRHCVSGFPPSVERVDALLGSVSHLRDLANMVQSQEGQQIICERLGVADGRRMITYFTGGPKFG
ncbi:uncharacterized protein MAM_03611 [Metarhizium album ARSEF 1941]|uniref:Uncharacterized protein n=1 Tax=Metarhizium album (strain ARSEF 1941) TaxID=1081103 RepID=A0A0B2WYI4_METAS|nr:uncharacterized protein MAM_03611 [Metarhizium album ARSEF 1941]KHN98487.1 hypothetical protein MAM_03611 [Metarhizium album ARSEF 1941]